MFLLAQIEEFVMICCVFLESCSVRTAEIIIQICVKLLRGWIVCLMIFACSGKTYSLRKREMIAIDQTPDEVVIHYHTRAGGFNIRGDYAIITVRFPV